MDLALQLEEALSEEVTPTGYRVSWVLVVDRPEKRMPGMLQPRAGTRRAEQKSFTSQKDAISFAIGLASGESDFAAEYPTDITVLRTYDNRSPTRVRKPVVRERGADGKVKTVSGS